jgi:phage repressor protein C with HTH and peptisase S24 domain
MQENKQEKSPIKQKILLYLTKKGVSEYEFYKKSGITRGILAQNNGISEENLARFLAYAPEVNEQWLLTGNGEMIKGDKREVAHQAENPKEGIPLIPFSAMAGALTGEQSVLEYECERYVVPAFHNADFLMPVKGNSMTPTYISGDIVACQRVPMTDIFFQWNKPYVLDTSQGAIIKRIKPGSDKDHVLIVSDNKEYDPFELPYKDIYAVALVIGLIRLE